MSCGLGNWFCTVLVDIVCVKESKASGRCERGFGIQIRVDLRRRSLVTIAATMVAAAVAAAAAAAAQCCYCFHAREKPSPTRAP